MGLPIKYNLRNLLQRKGTTLMTAFGIGLTVAVLVTSLALTTGLHSVFSASGHPLQLIVLRKGTDSELTSSVSSDAFNIVRQMRGVARNADGVPYASQEGLTVVNLASVEFAEGVNVTIRGMLPIGVEMRDITIRQGRPFTPGKREVMVGESIARRNPDAALGHEVHFGRGMWKVVGVFSAGDSAANSEIWTDLNQLRGDFERSGGSSSVLLRAESPSAMKHLEKMISDDQRLETDTMEEKVYYEKLTESGIFLEFLGYSVALIMAIGSAFAATNTMYAAVSRRAREIGTLRALGFSRSSILVSFVVESICLALLGGILGILIALPINGMTTGIGNFKTFSETAFQFRVTPVGAAVGLLFAAGIGAVGGFLPAWSASRKTIVQAMRES
jgi:ABC-type lipoprotein release transport system permease subunit